MKQRYISILLLLTINFLSYSQNKPQSDWKKYSELIENGYYIQFDYPSYLKFDRIENCLCLGYDAKNQEYNNTMDWGIWIDTPENYSEQDENFYKKEFGNDVVIKRESITISNNKAFRKIIRQPNGEKYEESIVIKFKDCVFEITNRKSESKDFERFYKSITITKK